VQFEGGYVMPCESCIKGNQHRKAFSNQDARRATDVLVHSDVCGPM
jgi:hypothetical protein